MHKHADILADIKDEPALKNLLEERNDKCDFPPGDEAQQALDALLNILKVQP